MDIEAIMAQIEASWVLRTERLQHNHIFQTATPARGDCSACDEIDPHHMSEAYVYQAKYRTNIGGWA